MAEIISLTKEPRETPTLLDVPTCLRNIADDIEAGRYNECVRAAIVLRCVGLEPLIFGPGKTDPVQSYMDFCAAAQQLMNTENPRRG